MRPFKTVLSDALLFKSVGFSKEINILFSKAALNWSKVS